MVSNTVFVSKMDLREQCLRINASGFSWSIDHARCHLKCDVTNVRLCPRYGIRESFSYRHEKLSVTWVWTPVQTAPKSGTETYPMSVTIHFQDWHGPASVRHRIPRVNGSVIWYSPVYWGVDIRELEQRHFWATHVNRKRSIFPFNMPWLYKICIPNGLFSYRDDLPRRKIAKRALPVDVRHSKASLLNKLPNIVYAVKKLRRTSRLKYRVKRANILNDPVWTKWPLKFCSRSKIRSVPCERSSHSLRYNILPKECTIQADCVQHSSLFIKCRTKVICVLFIAITIQKGTFLLN